MKEKLLVLLVAKFKGVPEAILERIATKKAGSVTDETQLQSIADGIDYGQIVQSEVDSKITDSNKKAVQNYEATHKLKDGKPVDPSPADPNPDDKNKDVAKLITDAVTLAVKPLQDKLAIIEGGKVNETRKSVLEAKLKDAPESVKGKVLKDFERMSFKEDADFDKYLTETETDIAALTQEFADKGLGQHGSPDVFGKKGADGVSAATQAYIESKTKDNKALGGKELSTK